MKKIYLILTLIFLPLALFGQAADQVIPWNQFSKRLPGRKMFMLKAVGQKVGGIMKIFPINKKTTNKIYREALDIVQNKLKLRLNRTPKLIISDYITGVSKQKTLDELIKKSGLTTKSEISQFKYGQEAQIVPAAYLPGNNIVVYRDNISIFSKLLSFKKAELRGAVKLALIHELIHAYQKQEILGLDRSISKNENYLYVIEGHATFITSEISKSLRLTYVNRVGLSFFTHLDKIGKKYRLDIGKDVLEHVDQGHIKGSAFFKKLRRKTRAPLGMWNQIKRIFYKKMVAPADYFMNYEQMYKKF